MTARSPEKGWDALAAFSDAFTCYSSAIGTWLAADDPDWPESLNPGLWLIVAERGDGRFAFSHFPPGLQRSLGLVRAGADEPSGAVEAVLNELEARGRVIVAGDGFNLPWHVAFERRHVPHWFVIGGGRDALEVFDPFSCQNDLGRQREERRPLAEDELPSLLRALPPGNPVMELREALAFGRDAGSRPPDRYQWFTSDTPPLEVALAGESGVAAIRRLARHFRDHGQEPQAYEQADDIWSIGRHRAFLTRCAAGQAECAGDAELRAWVDELLATLTRKWGHTPPLIMQATLALGAGRSASSSLPDLLHELAELEEAASASVPPSGHGLLDR